MAIIIFPENITINLPPRISPSLSQTLLEITSLQSLIILLLSPLLATLSYLCHAISLFLRITLFALRTKLTLPIVWSMDSDILEEMLMPITVGGPLFWLASAFILVFIVRSFFRAIFKSLKWVLELYISDSNCHAPDLKLCKWVLCRISPAKGLQSQAEKHTQTHTRMIPRFERLPRITLPKLAWTEAFSQPSKTDPTTPYHGDPDNADTLDKDRASSDITSEDDTLTPNTSNDTTTATTIPTTISSEEDIWGDLETY